MSGLKSWVGNRNGIPTPLQSTANGASHTANPTVNNRRQLAAAQARMPPPPTRLARQPLQPATDRSESRTFNSVAPTHTESEERPEVVADQFDRQDHFGGLFDTDAEGMDETSILSEIQVKDSQVNDQGTAHVTSPWGTMQPEGDRDHATNQADNDGHDAQMENYGDDNAEGSEDEGASGFEEEEDMSDDAELPPDDDATVVSLNLAQALRDMKADPNWRALVERPNNRASIAHRPKQTVSRPAVRQIPEPTKEPRGGAQNGVRNTHNAYSGIMSGESDLDDENDEASREKIHGPADRKARPLKAHKRPDSQPKVVRVPQVKQAYQMRPPPAQQPHEEVRPGSVKQEPPLNQQRAPDKDPQSTDGHEIDHTEDVKPDHSDIDHANENDSKQNASAPLVTKLLPEQPPPNPIKRRLSLDYDPTTLHSMTYTDLKTQPFDHNPRTPPSTLPEPLQSAPLPSKLEHITTLPDADRSTFFSTLTLSEWEESGDWFVGRFSELVKKMKGARTERRRVAGEFEEEIARREEYVRKSREGVEGQMRKMRKGGEDVLRNKVS